MLTKAAKMERRKLLIMLDKENSLSGITTAILPYADLQ